MPGHEERNLRREKREQKRRTAKQGRARVRKALDSGDYESPLETPEIPPKDQVREIHVGRNTKGD
jgi:hypothetical protein